jgi:hypothetical protein
MRNFVIHSSGVKVTSDQQQANNELNSTAIWRRSRFSWIIIQIFNFSHAVGVAFAICLERKQQREADCGVTMNYNETDGTFTRFGSFRYRLLTNYRYRTGIKGIFNTRLLRGQSQDFRPLVFFTIQLMQGLRPFRI